MTTPQYLSKERINRLHADMHDAFKSRVTLPLSWRLHQLQQLRLLVTENLDAIGQACMTDNKKPFFEVTLAETAGVVKDIDLALDNLTEWTQATKVATPIGLQPSISYIHPQPVGVVLNIAPWNFPFRLCLLPLVGAIASGCCMLIKPSEISPTCAQLLQDLVEKYLDNYCYTVVQGEVAETQHLLSLKFDHILYTGSGGIGRIVMQAAAKSLTPVTLELGGKSPVIVDQQVNLEIAVKRICNTKFMNCGQVCIAPDYVLIHEDVHDKFVRRATEVVASFFGVEPRQSESYARIINKRHHQRIVDILMDDHGGNVVVGGDWNAADNYVAPTIIDNPRLDSKAMQEEIFGPVLSIISVKSVEHAIEIVNSRERPLALYIFSDNTTTQQEIINHTTSGGVCIND
eukprot:GFYU01024762.1.p1 GENE.GFYU01024762.1~~GFYU01024762.1.p1  ORF type:complete len:402 (+),score=73.74 GFYU01024762.1:140-1345(+)